MSGFYFTPIRLKADDFPSQVNLFLALKKPVYFRNITLDYIKIGGWSELPLEHYKVFIKALKEGYVYGERQWNVDFHQYTRRWVAPSWIRLELPNETTSDKVTSYVERSKQLLAEGIHYPFTNAAVSVPGKLTEYIVTCMEATDAKNISMDYYSEYFRMISSNLEAHPNTDIAHRTYQLLQHKVKDGSRYAQLDILDTLSHMNQVDRNSFLSWLFQSPKHLEAVRNANWSAGDIIMSAVLSGEVWYNEGTSKKAPAEVI